jgi:hypothetical protein
MVNQCALNMAFKKMKKHYAQLLNIVLMGTLGMKKFLVRTAKKINTAIFAQNKDNV